MKLLIISAVILLTGCQTYQKAVATKAAQGADDLLRASAYGVCQGATDGALERKWQVNTNPNGPNATSRRQLCYGNIEEIKD